MNEFIHTFSITNYLSFPHTRTMEKIYGEDFFYNHIEKKYIFSKYADKGFRMEVKFASSKEKRYQKKHYDYKAVWIVTPAKLLYPGQPMMKLFTTEEYSEACRVLHDILSEIKMNSGIDLLNEAKLCRADITKDIETSSDLYSQEVIRLSKKALNQYGYNLWEPTEEEIQKTGWAEENSILFRNHNQEVESKIYNKLEDLRNNGYDPGNLSGLIRFELSLKRKFMKTQELMKEKYLTIEELSCILGNILDQASELMQTHITTPLWSGAMLSKDLQKKYIKKYCKNKKAKYEKMMSYRRKCNRKGVYHDPTMERYFGEIGLSPLYTDNTIRYIPSFADLLTGNESEQIRRFLQLHE